MVRDVRQRGRIGGRGRIRRAEFLSALVRTVHEVALFRHCCLVCGRTGEPLCLSCRRRLTPPPSTRVRGVGRVPALFAYEGVGATVVQSLKFRDGRRLVTPLADALADVVRSLHWADERVVCTWLPTSGGRRRRRGFDQSELLARAVARRLDAPALSVLRRRPGRAQTGRTRMERDRNVEFHAVCRVDRPLLVVDDVCTTGATIRAASTALGEVDAPVVRFVTVARTP